MRNYRTEKVTKRPAGIRTGDLSLTGRMLFRLSHKSRSVVNGVRIRLSQSIPSPSLTSHLLSYTLHARFGKSFFFFFEIKKEKSEKLPNGKGDQETCRDSNRGPWTFFLAFTDDEGVPRNVWSTYWTSTTVPVSITNKNCVLLCRSNRVCYHESGF